MAGAHALFKKVSKRRFAANSQCNHSFMTAATAHSAVLTLAKKCVCGLARRSVV